MKAVSLFRLVEVSVIIWKSLGSPRWLMPGVSSSIGDGGIGLEGSSSEEPLPLFLRTSYFVRIVGVEGRMGISAAKDVGHHRLVSG
jgi:hypothetical protein